MTLSSRFALKFSFAHHFNRVDLLDQIALTFSGIQFQLQFNSALGPDRKWTFDVSNFVHFA